MDEREEYKREIIDMIENMESVSFLFKIYHYILPKYKKEKEAGD